MSSHFLDGLTIVVPAKKVHRYDKRTKGIKVRLWIGGYVSNVYKQKRDVADKAKAWKGWVRNHITRALPPLPPGFTPIPSKGWHIITQAYFSANRHVDPCNVHKAIEDILVWRRKHSSTGTFLFLEDNHFRGSYGAPRYDTARPRVEITIRRDEAWQRESL